MIRKIVIGLFIFCLALPVMGQRWKLRRVEALFGVGSTQVFGDIGGTADENNLYGLKDIRFDETRPAFSAGARYKIDQRYAVKFNTNIALGAGADLESKNEGRGFSYSTVLLETAFLGEYYFLSEDRKRLSPAMYNRRGMINYYSTFTAYAFTGFAPVFFWPDFEGETRGPEIDQTDDYSKISLALPVGLGIKYTIDDSWIFGVEFGGRYVFSDFIDGYKNILYSKHNDIYYLLSFSFNYRIKTSPKGLPRFLDRKYRRIR